jgi:tripartite-type tricarboxylate transporter receptor subunit TctC
VPFNAGSGSDTGARVYGEILSKELGQPVIVENRPGGSGLLTIQAVKAAPADGHTIMLASNSPMTVNPVVMKDLPYDPVKDFRPISGLGRGAVAFIVRGDSPAKSVADLVSLAKNEKRSLVVGNYSAGYRLVAAWLGTATGSEVTHVAYKGGAQMMNDIIGAQLDTGAIDFGGAAPLIKEGRLRALAITGDKRHPDFPDVPTMKESGFPEFETYVWTSFFVRADTPDDVTKTLADAMQKVLVSPAAKAYQATIPTQPMLFGPDEMRAFQLSEIERFGRVAKAAGIEPQ